MLQLRKRGPWYYVEGKNSVGTKVKRHTTECTSKQAAWAYLKSIDTAAEWPPKKVEEKVDIALTDALVKYLQFIRPKTKEGTRQYYEYSAKKHTIAFLAAECKITTVSAVSRDHLVAMQDGWIDRLAYNTIQSYRRVSNAFFAYCVSSKYLPANPWDDVPRLADDESEATLPLDEEGDANWRKVREGLIPFLQTLKRPSNPLWRNPESFLALVELMYHTGLRRSDAVLFDPREIAWEPEIGLWSYSTKQLKTRKPVTIFLEPWLRDKLAALPLLAGARQLPFYDGTCETLDYYMDWYVSEPLRKLGQSLQLSPVRGVSDSLRCHRLRDSFSVNYLIDGGSMEDLMSLLGHKSIRVTEKYYAKWTKGRSTAIGKRFARVREQAAFRPLEAAPPASQLTQ